MNQQIWACDNVKLDVEIGGKLRRINVGKQHVSSNIEITDEIEIDATGFPSKESWFEKSDEIASSLLETMDIAVEIETSVESLPTSPDRRTPSEPAIERAN